MSKLYSLVRENIYTGNRSVVYATVTKNVIDEYWEGKLHPNTRLLIEDVTRYVVVDGMSGSDIAKMLVP